MPGHERTPALIARNHSLLSDAADARRQTKAIIAQSEAAVSQAMESMVAVVARRAARANGVFYRPDVSRGGAGLVFRGLGGAK